MTENWKDITGYEGLYQVSDLGRVKSLARQSNFATRWGTQTHRKVPERVLAHGTCRDYLIVNLSKEGETKMHRVSRLVAQAFLPNQKQTVNHKDGVKTNNAVSNLEWATPSENLLHAVRIRLHSQATVVVDPATGVRYASIAQAAKGAHKSHRKVSATFIREAQPCQA
jgi:hypothetical protein